MGNIEKTFAVESNIKEIESKLKRISDLLIETNKVLEELASMKVKVFFSQLKIRNILNVKESLDYLFKKRRLG